MDQVVAENGVQQSELLSAVNDDHGGVIVEMKEPMDSEAFLSMLRASISQWKKQGKKGVWIKLPIGLVNLVETAVKEGFQYHHAEPRYLMLVYWIPEAGCTVPANASHRVRVGAIVMNDKREIHEVESGSYSFPEDTFSAFPKMRFLLSSSPVDTLRTFHDTAKYMRMLLVVQERCGKLQGKGMWKIPTGVVDEGEDIFAAAVREVKEETNIDTEFVEILAFRQFHKIFFEKSDLFFLCILHPLSFDIQKQELEIEAAQWMPFEEYAAQPITQKHGLFKYISEICLAKVDREYVGFSRLPITSSFDDQVSYIYLNNHDPNQQNSTFIQTREIPHSSNRVS